MMNSVSKSSPRTSPRMMISTSAAAAMIVIRTVSWSSCLRQRGLLLLDAAEHAGDVADLGRHPRRRHHHLSAATGDLRVHVGHVDAVAEGDLVAGDRVDDLRDRCALAGEAGLLDLERGRRPGCGRRRGPCRPPRSRRCPREPAPPPGSDPLAVATDARRHDEHLAEGRDALRRLALLVQTHHRVQDRQPEHDQPCRDVLQGDDADDRGPDQHQLHEVPVLAQEQLPGRLLRLLGQLVRPVALPPRLDLGRAQADRRIHVQPPADIVRGQSVPVGDSVGAGAVATVISSPRRKGRPVAPDGCAIYRVGAGGSQSRCGRARSTSVLSPSPGGLHRSPSFVPPPLSGF